MSEKIGFFESRKKSEYQSLLQQQQKVEGRKNDNLKCYGATSSIELNQTEYSSNFFVDTTTQTPSYPVAVIFVLFSKLLEAFAANGIRSILALYLRDNLHYDEMVSTTVLHTFNFFSQFLPIFGAILADSYFGNSNTISLFYIPYSIGYVGIFLGTFSPSISPTFIYSSLLLVAIGNGCLRACIAALGGHQFILPEQKLFLDRYFSLYYFFYYIGILLGKIVPAYMRTENSFTDACQESGDCYPAVFGSILLVFLISWIVFLCGYRFYRTENVTGSNTILRAFSCISYAIYIKFKGQQQYRANSWLSASIGKYSEAFVNDVSVFLKVVTLFLPIPVYYALLAQQDSSWTFQATKTNTTLLNVTIQADQFKAIGPILLLILIPTWQRIAQPLLGRFKIQISPLRSVSIGGLFASLSFIWAGFLQRRIHSFPEEFPSILWQFPMFFLMMFAEVLISVPGIQFCYVNAPSSMKSVLTAVWFINNAIGNLIVVLVSQFRFLSNQTIEFFFYALLMLFATAIFTILAWKYEKNETWNSNNNNNNISNE